MLSIALGNHVYYIFILFFLVIYIINYWLNYSMKIITSLLLSAEAFERMGR